MYQVNSISNRRTKGSALLEILMMLGILITIVSVSIPMYRNFQLVQELDTVTNDVLQALHRAKLLSELSEGDAGWGVSVPQGTIFQGATYMLRQSQFDEIFGMPETITATGLTEVSFAKLSGAPSGTGIIILTALTGAQRRIGILGSGSIGAESDDGFDICHIPRQNPENAHTLRIPDSAWPAHEAHGDTIGPCPGDNDD